MRDRRYQSFSIRGPVILFIVVVILSITLTVLWNVVLVHDYQELRELAAQSGAFHGTMIALGSVLFLGIIVLSCILIVQFIHNIHWSQRQADFIASASHELNSPLSSIKLFTQTLQRGELDPEKQAEFLKKIRADIDRLSQMISNILRAAEVDHHRGELEIAPEEVDLYEYLHQYIEHAALSSEDKLAVVLTGEGSARVALDRMMFRQVLDNLLDNAIRYRRGQRAHVELQVLRDGDNVELRVVDDGIGIPKTEVRKLFDRFYRVQGTRSDKNRRGMGIGLAVVRSIVLGHGGTVSANSDGPGKGTTISMQFPAVTQRSEQLVS